MNEINVSIEAFDVAYRKYYEDRLKKYESGSYVVLTEEKFPLKQFEDLLKHRYMYPDVYDIRIIKERDKLETEIVNYEGSYPVVNFEERTIKLPLWLEPYFDHPSYGCGIMEMKSPTGQIFKLKYKGNQ